MSTHEPQRGQIDGVPGWWYPDGRGGWAWVPDGGPAATWPAGAPGPHGQAATQHPDTSRFSLGCGTAIVILIVVLFALAQGADDDCSREREKANRLAATEPFSKAHFEATEMQLLCEANR